MTQGQTGPTEAGAIAELALDAAGGTILQAADGRCFLITGANAEIKEITDPHELLPAPVHIKRQVIVQTLDSLVAYVDRFKGADTLLFADISANRIVGLVDYHGPDQPRNVDHAVTMDLPFSEEWKVWTGVSGKMMSQLDFARFIEENAADVESPQATDLIEVTRDLQAIRKADFRQAVRTASDNESFEYVVDNNLASPKGVEIPTKFVLRLPVYFGGQTLQLQAFLRWAIDDGKLALGIKLHRAEHVRQAEFKQIVLDAAGRTDRLAVFGKA